MCERKKPYSHTHITHITHTHIRHKHQTHTHTSHTYINTHIPHNTHTTHTSHSTHITYTHITRTDSYTLSQSSFVLHSSLQLLLASWHVCTSHITHTHIIHTNTHTHLDFDCFRNLDVVVRYSEDIRNVFFFLP